MKRTKIVCTIGPASEKLSTLKAMLRAGMNVARLNFSHGTYASHAKLIKTIRRASKETGIPVALLQDLQGPRIRIGELPAEGVEIKRGDTVVLVPERGRPSPSLRGSGRGLTTLPQQYKNLARDVTKGVPILIADGAMRLRVEKIVGDAIHCTVIEGGVVKSHKGINVPGVSLGAKPITKKDEEDLQFGLKQGVDFITLSFVKTAKDVVSLRRLIARGSKKSPLSLQERVGVRSGEGAPPQGRGKGVRSRVFPNVVAKVERPEAIDNIESIVAEADAIMLGRGDLALEANPATLAVMQERVIGASIFGGKPVIVATQMLESLMEHRQATRAELSDIGHAVMDHTDATMLSGETAGGKNPVLAVKLMADVIRETETSQYDNLPADFFGAPETSEGWLARAVRDMVDGLKVSTVVVMEKALSIVPHIVRLRPEARIVPVVSDERVGRPLLLSWGTYPITASKSITSGKIITALQKDKTVRRGDHVVIVTRMPQGKFGVAECLKMEVV